MTEQHVLIAGGGIAGLTLAVALEHRGHQVVVLEKRATYGKEGAGIIVAQNALRMFDRIGLGAAVRRAGHRLGSMDVRTSEDVLLQRVEALDSVTIHRDQLHRILRDAIRGPVHMNCAPHEIHMDPSGVRVQSRLGSHRADVLVGADGIRSDVRRRVFGDLPVTSSGQTCWRAVVPVERSSAVEYWAPGRRVGLIPLSGARTYIYLVQDQAKGAADAWGDNIHALRAAFGAFPTEVQTVLGAIASVSQLRRGHLEQVLQPTWHQQRAVLIGDAAHAMTPNMGQGACQAIEDAVVLAASLDEANTLASGLNRYVQLRRGRADAIQRQSWWIGVVSQMTSPTGRFLRDQLMRLTPAWSARRAARSLGDVPGVHRSASAAIHGRLLMLTGIAHTVAGGLVFWPIYTEMLRGGGYDSIGEHFGRGTAFWFIAFGVLLFTWGHLMDQAERLGPLPQSVAWQLLAVWAAGAWFIPASGFWLALPQGLYLLLRRNEPSIDSV